MSSAAQAAGARVGGRADAEARPAGVVAEGRVVAYPGAEATVGAERGGRVMAIVVEENDVVSRGGVVVVLDVDVDRAALARARAQLDAATAEVRFLELQMGRIERLAETHSVAQQRIDEARRDLDTARARRAALAAEVRQIGILVEQSRARSPIAGTVIARHVMLGQTVSSGTPLVTVADLSRVRVEAEVVESDAGRVRIGAPVTVTAEGYHAQSWRGVVEEIPDAVVGSRLRPQNPARPIDTRVLLVKIALTGPTPLKLGQRVEVFLENAQRDEAGEPLIGRGHGP